MAEQNYSTVEKELLAIVEACRHFRPYVYGRKFTIVTDHTPLTWLWSLKTPNSRLIRWKIKLEEYDFEIKYKKGKENSVADALRRLEINTHEKDDSLSMIAQAPDVASHAAEEVDEVVDDDIITVQSSPYLLQRKTYMLLITA